MTPPADPTPSDLTPENTPDPEDAIESRPLSDNAYNAEQFIAQALAVARMTEGALSDSVEWFDTKASLRAIAHLLEHALDHATVVTWRAAQDQDDR